MESQTIPSTADRADSEMVAAAEGTDPTPEVTEDTSARQQPLAGPPLNSGPPDAALPGARSAEYIYRITDLAAAVLDSVAGTPHVTVSRPSPEPDSRVLLRSGVVDVLLGLRLAAGDVEAGKVRRWIEAEPEWRSSLELTAWTAAEHERTGGNRPYFVGDDLRWAVAHNLVERNAVQVKDRGVVIYRITVTGAAVEPLEWHGPTGMEPDGGEDPDAQAASDGAAIPTGRKDANSSSHTPNP